MLDLARTLISFAVVLGVLVFVHEFGHYLAARWAGIRVEAFSIGFGAKLAGWTDRHGTEWRLCALPLGGYVKMHGMEQQYEIAPQEMAQWNPAVTFHGKPVAKRAIVVAAGPVANFLLAIVLFAGLFMVVGRSYTTPLVQQLVAGGPAQAAGLHPGDLITAINGAPVVRFEQLQAIVSHSAGKRLMITVARGGRDLTMPITPVAKGNRALIGIIGGGVAFEHLAPSRALGAAVAETWEIGRDDLAGIVKIFTGGASTQDLSGAIGIAQMSGEAARSGPATLLYFIAFISVNLGLINLFPIPVLDGGHLLFFAAEAVRGKPLPARVQGYALYVGLSVIVALMVIGARNDLGRLGVFHWIAQRF